MSKFIFFLIKTFIGLIDFFSSELAGKLAIFLSSFPMRRPLRDFEKFAYDSAEISSMDHKDFDIKLYKWGSGRKRLLLVHGWEGHIGHFSKLIESIDLDQWTVEAFDAPAHGMSSGRKADTFEFSDMLEELIKEKPYDAVLAHSFGSVAIAFSLGTCPQVSIPLCIMIAPPDTFRGRVESVRQTLGLSQKAAEYTLNYYSDLLGMPVDELSVSHFAPLSSVERSIIITDVNDKISPYNP